MPRKSTTSTFQCMHYRWGLYRRKSNSFFYADGRGGNGEDFGRHALGTQDRLEAIERLRLLDHQYAVRTGKIACPQPAIPTAFPLADGIRLYLEHVRRPAIAGGASPKTQQRYHAVLTKFSKFAAARRIYSWNEVTAETVTAYLADLERDDYAPRTLYIEATTILQVIKHSIKVRKLPETCRISLPLSKESETTTYCYTRAEVDAILVLCRRTPGLDWLGDVVLAQSRTGMRIGELAQLTWSDVDLSRGGNLHLRHETASSGARPRKTTKSKRSRSVPIHPDLRVCLIQRRKGAKPHDPVFTGPSGGRLDPDSVRMALIHDVLTPLAASGCLPARDDGRTIVEGRVHSFRHHFTSQCIQGGVPTDTVQKWLGHRDSAMVAHYSHLASTDSHRQIAKISFAEPGDAQATSARARSA